MSVSDSGSVRSSLRGSTFLIRPQLTPMGPRVRKSRSNLVETQSLLPTLDLQEFGGSALNSTSRPTSMTPSSPSSSSFISDRMSLPAVTEEHTEPAPAYEEEETRSITRSHSQDLSAPAPPPKLVPPPGITFESTPVLWKALPLEAALWTLDSQELQNIVSRAIHSSEVFIRLLTLENIDNVLPAELERLDALKAVTQSKYRFLVHRRTMLFQALNSSLASTSHKNGEGALTIGKLVSQLAETTAECEKLSGELLSISDQTAQINKLIDIHCGSAFAVALRKLNGSLARRTADLAEAKERITQLEIDVEEAWKEAQNLAKELDDYENELTADDAEAIIEVAEIVPIQPSSPTQSRRSSTPLSPTLLSIAPPVTVSTSPMATRSTLGSHFVFPPPVIHLKEKENEAEDVPDTVSIRSSHSTRSAKSTKSTREGGVSRTSSVQAAKRRSHRASQSSLRLTTGHSRKQSSIRVKSPYQQQPPVPELPLRFTDNIMPTSTPYASSALLHDSKSPSLRRQGSLDTVCTSRSPATSAATVAFRGRSADDMYVRPYNSSSSEIQLVPRSQVNNLITLKYETSISENNVLGHFPPENDVGPIATTSKSIPSMWTNVDAVKTPLPLPSSSPPPQAHVQLGLPLPEPELVLAHSKSMKSKFKTLTQRYSVSLPIFNSKSSQGSRPASRSRSS